jgi:hypothetical protein
MTGCQSSYAISTLGTRKMLIPERLWHQRSSGINIPLAPIFVQRRLTGDRGNGECETGKEKTILASLLATLFEAAFSTRGQLTFTEWIPCGSNQMSYIKPPGANESMISVLPLLLPVDPTDLNPRIRHLAVVSVLKISISPYATDRRASSITMRIGFRHALPATSNQLVLFINSSDSIAAANAAPQALLNLSLLPHSHLCLFTQEKQVVCRNQE